MTATTADGRDITITSVTQTIRTDATYNITVADFETYFVGKQRVLVHNWPPGGNAGDVRKANIEKGIPESQLGPSGKPKIHNSNSATRKQAVDGAKNDPAGSGAIARDSATPKQPSHYHSVKTNGKRVSGPNKTHYNKRGDKPK